MKHQPTLENVLTAYQAAPQDRRAAALAALLGAGANGTPTGKKILRWREAARLASLTPRSLRYAVETAGIDPVVLPGRQRAIGIRETDFRNLFRLES